VKLRKLVDREHNLANSELAHNTLEIPLLEVLQQNSGHKGTSEHEIVFRDRKWKWGDGGC
jgi:hypothetical protein